MSQPPTPQPSPVYSDVSYRKLQAERNSMDYERQYWKCNYEEQLGKCRRLEGWLQLACIAIAVLGASVVVLALKNEVVMGWFR